MIKVREICIINDILSIQKWFYDENEVFYEIYNDKTYEMIGAQKNLEMALIEAYDLLKHFA